MNGRRARPHGEIRQSQLLTTYGPGAMLDLPNHSVLVGGLEHWSGDRQRIYEARLEAWLQEGRDGQPVALFRPPVDSSDPNAPTSGVGVFLFPTWFVAQVDQTWRAPDGRVYRTRPLLPYGRLVRGGYLDDDRKRRAVVPIRFVQACGRGHISDVDWYGFVRRDHRTERTGDLWLDEGGAGNDFAEIYIRDVKRGHQRRPLSEAMVKDAPVLGMCEGRMPWLGPHVWEPCDRFNWFLTRSASNTYFAQTQSVISIPEANKAVKEAVNRVWQDNLQYCASLHAVQMERRREKVQVALVGITDEAVWAEVKRRLEGVVAAPQGIKQAELETFLTQKPTLGADTPAGDFYARAHALGPLPPEAADKVDRLVLVHRLREVTVQLGFTRFDPSVRDVDGELDLNIELASLARDASWLPAFDKKGEGVFVSFPKKALEQWFHRPGVQARHTQLVDGFDVWKRRRGVPDLKAPNAVYVMLHSLSHLLLTVLALDCGYSASAIQERIYLGKQGGGILLYTGTPGAEGTLGGLVELGRELGGHLQRVLELGALCSNDPICAQHDPADPLEERFRHGAACHGCLLISETSCEHHNELLDRALVVPTVAHPDAAFLGDWRVAGG